MRSSRGIRFERASAPSRCSRSTASGRQAEALAGYDAFRAQLADELGSEPSAVCGISSGRILQQDPDLDLEAAGRGGPSRFTTTCSTC